MANFRLGQRKVRDLTAEALRGLLEWLDQNPETAGIKYEQIRRRLILIFAYRGCTAPEDLADQTIDRVAGKAQQIAATYVGNPEFYFLGVANKIWHESRKRKPLHWFPAAQSTLEIERRGRCLEECLRRLPAASRDLIWEYYGTPKTGNPAARKELAERLGLGANALWIRAHRIRGVLRQCMSECLRGSLEFDIIADA